MNPLTIYCFVDKDSPRSYRKLEDFIEEMEDLYPVEFIIEEFDATEAIWVERFGKKYLDDAYITGKCAPVYLKHKENVDIVHFFIDEDNWQNTENRLYGFQLGKRHFDYYICVTKFRRGYEDTAEHETLHTLDNYVWFYANLNLASLFGVSNFDSGVVHNPDYWKKDYFYDEVWEKIAPVLSIAIGNKRRVTAPPTPLPLEPSESIPETYRPKHFGIHELVSKDVYEKHGERAWQFFDERLLRNMDWIRDNLGAVYVNNWKWGGNNQYRGFDACEYRKEGTSQHNHGRGCDFNVKGKSPQEVTEWIKSHYLEAPEPNMWLEVSKNGQPISWNHLDVRYSDVKGVYEFDA